MRGVFDEGKKRVLEGWEGLVVAPLTFLEMKIEVGFDSVEPGEAALGETPEGFNAIDVSAAPGKGFLFVDADVLVEGVLSGTPKAPILQVTGTNDRYALTPFGQGIDVTALSGKTVFVQGVLPQSARGKVPATLRYKTIAVVQ